MESSSEPLMWRAYSTNGSPRSFSTIGDAQHRRRSFAPDFDREIQPAGSRVTTVPVGVGEQIFDCAPEFGRITVDRQGRVQVAVQRNGRVRGETCLRQGVFDELRENRRVFRLLGRRAA